jgi:UDP-glucose 4-epimerase
MSRAIVTGGAGFIGSNLVDRLINDGYEVIVIDNLIQGQKEFVNTNATFVNADIRDKKSIEKYFKNVDYVFHLAALPSVQLSFENPVEFNEVNVDGLLNVLHLSHLNKIKRVVFSSSAAIYGGQTSELLTEEHSSQPMCPYSLQKLIGEQYCQVFSKTYGLETVCLRYFNVYGDRMRSVGAYSFVIPIFLDQKKANKPMTIRGDGNQQRDFVNAKDVANANILASLSTKVGKGEFINIGTQKGTSVNEIADMIGGEKIFVEAVREPKVMIANNSKAKKLLGWEPKINLKEYIECVN